MKKKLEKAGFEEKRFHTGDILMNYIRGPTNGLPLVLIPGQGASWENYNKVLKPLSKCFEVFAVDIRGHGKSEWATDNYSFKTIGADMEVFLKQVVKRPAILSGNSSGGLISIWLAKNISEYVLGIIAEDAPFFSAEWPINCLTMPI
ncbi:MAG: Haloalkane dehalogenase [Promethearchaeota archaeon]|nr:MAG: Haloalkane dehalogenase [Candidatus Lokiarchaeota archaeon]